MPVTFPVAQVELGKPYYPQTRPLQDIIKNLIKVPPEAWGSNVGSQLTAPQHVPQKLNGFMNAAHTAFDLHYPFTLSPDDVWLAIAQGFAHHVNQNAEKLRHYFVQHEGKKHIEIQRDMFVKGSPDNDWMGGFSEFSDKIAEHIGKKRDLLVGNFTTTGPIELAASQVVLMDAMSSYFSYGVSTACGIPSVTLLGTIDDWESVRDRAQALSEFECESWVQSLVPVLDEFVQAFKGTADPQFWGSFVKLNGMSGGPYISGWVNVFFPYLGTDKKRTNHSALNWRVGSGPKPEQFPCGLSRVPFTWNYSGQELPMQFLGGFVGFNQTQDDLVIRPTIGWAVADKPA